MFDYRFNKLLKKANLGTGRVNFLENSRAAKLARAIRIFNTSDEKIIVSPGDGYGLIRLANILHVEASSFIRREESGVLRDGQAGFVVDLSKIGQVLQ